MPKKISYICKSKLIRKDNKDYLYKVKSHNKEKLFNYLRLKDFQNFLPPEEVTDSYEIYPFIKEKNIPIEDKAIELINILSLLHTKTTTYQEVNKEKLEEDYDKIKQEILYLKNYYLDLQDFLETREFMAPAEYILMINISKFHKALKYAERKLDDWFQEKQNTIKERVVQVHKNITLDHFLIGDNSYFINWDKSTKATVIYDFLNFYKNEFSSLEMSSLFDQYQSKYEYTKDELLLFQALISIPKKITFKNSNIINVIEARRVISYVEKTNAFLSKYNEKNKEANSQEFKQ